MGKRNPVSSSVSTKITVCEGGALWKVTVQQEDTRALWFGVMLTLHDTKRDALAYARVEAKKAEAKYGIRCPVIVGRKPDEQA